MSGTSPVAKQAAEREVIVRLADSNDDPLLVHKPYPECKIEQPHLGSTCKVWNPKGPAPAYLVHIQ